MKKAQDYTLEFESLQNLMAKVGRERSTEKILQIVTQAFAERDHVAFARIWLVQPGENCNSCHEKHHCRTASCLHLVAAASIYEENKEWVSLNGDDRYIPLGFSEIGNVADTGTGVLIYNVNDDKNHTFNDIRGKDPRVMGIGIQPLLLRNEILGVIAVYTLIDIKSFKLGDLWLKSVANFTASAIANARAFEKVGSLKGQLELENRYLREEICHIQSFGGLVGISPLFVDMLDQVKQVAPTHASVLILGESGTGKELVAREIHKRSERGNRPMISVNCASIPGELYESEFFGHTKGAFTGAVSDRGGRFQAADGGTLFLDEVGEIPLSVQGKLLRVLQEGLYERIGEERTRKVDVRIVAATNRDLEKEVGAGRFRRDLYYRLNVFPIKVPPLRKRKKDIPLLAGHFLKIVSARMHRALPGLTESNISELMAYPWPGNVRELQNVVERAVIISKSNTLFFHLPANSSEFETGEKPLGALAPTSKKRGVFTEKEIKTKIRKNIILALQICNGKIYGSNGAAALLEISPTTLSSRISRLNITPEEIFNAS